MNVPRRELEIALRRAAGYERALYLGALLARAIDGPVIITGGSAIDVYASGTEPSLDLDFVTPGGTRPRATRVLASWGFVPNGKNWRRDDWEIEVDLRGSEFRGSRSKARRFETPYGPVWVAGPEDLLVKRLAELKHWPTAGDWREALLRQISLLLSEEGETMDEEYLSFVARRDDVLDILAEFRSRVRPRRNGRG